MSIWTWFILRVFFLQTIIPVLERAGDDAVWHSPIGKLQVNTNAYQTHLDETLQVEIDTARHHQPTVELPKWKEGFQLYISEIPGRSIIYFERFQQRPMESLVQL